MSNDLDKIFEKEGKSPFDTLNNPTETQFRNLPKTIERRVFSSLLTEPSQKNIDSNLLPMDQESLIFLEQLRNFGDNLDSYTDSLKDENLEILLIFKDLWMEYVIRSTENSELKDIDSSFVEVMFLSLKPFLSNVLDQFTLEDIQKKDFLEQCRKFYPQAALGMDHKLDSKSFISTTKDNFLKNFWTTFLLQTKDDFLGNIVSNYTGGELFVECLKYANKKSKDFLKEYQTFLLDQLMLLFEVDHNKKLSKKKGQKNFKAQTKQNSATIAASLDISPKNKLSEVQKELLNTLILSFPGLDGKIKKSIKSYLTRVVKNNWKLNKESFLQQYQLTEIPSQALVLLEELGIEILDTNIEDIFIGEEVEEDQSFPLGSKAEGEETSISINRKSLSSDELLDLSEEDLKLIPKDFLLSIADNELLLELLLNLIEIYYFFENRRRTGKEIMDYLLKANKRSLIIDAIFHDNFTKPEIKYVGAYALDIGMKMRFLLTKDKKGFWIDGLYTHGDYINRLKEKKR